jgi:hypothetical protein
MDRGDMKLNSWGSLSDLAFLRVYKFKMVKQLTLLGYSYEDGTVILELIALGSHENFYRDVKKLF